MKSSLYIIIIYKRKKFSLYFIYHVLNTSNRINTKSRWLIFHYFLFTDHWLIMVYKSELQSSIKISHLTRVNNKSNWKFTIMHAKININ